MKRLEKEMALAARAHEAAAAAAEENVCSAQSKQAVAMERAEELQGAVQMSAARDALVSRLGEAEGRTEASEERTAYCERELQQQLERHAEELDIRDQEVVRA
eukprot:gene34004-43951_t